MLLLPMERRAGYRAFRIHRARQGQAERQPEHQ